MIVPCVLGWPAVAWIALGALAVVRAPTQDQPTIQAHREYWTAMADNNHPPFAMPAVDRILSSEVDSVDVVLLDRQMPVLHGLLARPPQALGDAGP